MNSKNNRSEERRKFLKSSTLGAAALLGTSPSFSDGQTKRISGLTTEWSADGLSGLLFSQVGYEAGQPVRVLIRLPRKDALPPGAVGVLTAADDPAKKQQAPCTYWGSIWKSHWWVADFSATTEAGEWTVAIQDGSNVLMQDAGLKISQDILWHETIHLASVDMLERRRHFTKVGAGWQDAGTLWVESPAQSAMIIALTELQEQCGAQLEPAFTQRLHEQLTVGCDYLVMTQAKAEELGFPKGSLSHDLLGHEKDILPHDAAKAVVALLRTVQTLPDDFQEKKDQYRATAYHAYQWLVTQAQPMGDYGYSRFQRGLPEDTPIPADEWPTRDLLILCQVALEMVKHGRPEAKEEAVQRARQLMDRQITRERSESSFYGHFKEYDSLPHSEPSWTHGIIATPEGSQFGTDMGGIYPNYLMPLLEMIRRWPDHADATRWKETLRRFTDGYLIPACEKNPFYLVPQGIFGEEGPVWFCGSFHGTNTIYGYTAALALDLDELFDEPRLRRIAYGNLQWVAGLNAGITRENVAKGCVVYSTDLPENQALPASMICGVGQRWAGTWFQTRGVICNGFTTGEQFKYDVAPKKENDGPFSLTDEDWIPHSAAWITGLIRLKNLS